MSTTTTFPKQEWATRLPAEAGMDPDKLDHAKQWLDENTEGPKYRLAVVRHGYVVALCSSEMDANAKTRIASAAKSIYSNVLGIAVAEKTIPSADARVVDYYPEMMDVPEDGGPKPGRYAFEKDRDITFRQLISNTSGYMKPEEEPGKVFHYQTYSMNILTHALAKLYGCYDVGDPEGSAGFKKLIEEKLGARIGAHWEYTLMNFKLQESARLEIFGHYCQTYTDPLDFARLGWLWCNYGRWENAQIIPEEWMRESVNVAPDIRANCPEKEWKYGYGFWTNGEGKLWPGLPRDGFSACGAGGHYCSVFPSRSLVIVQNPGPHSKADSERANPELLEIVLEACQ